MTHDELLAKIKTPNEFLGVKYAPDWQHIALLAVVELHSRDKDGYCNGCASWQSAIQFPCPTIQAIEKELK